MDFLNPRRHVPPTPYSRRNLILAGSLLAVVLVLGFLFFSTKSELDSEIEQLQKTSTALDSRVKKMGELAGRVELIDEFRRGDITWINELASLSERFPNDQAYVEQFTASVMNEGGGRIGIVGQADSHSTIELIESSLRDERHQVFGRGGTEDPKRTDYRWAFDEAVIVAGPDPEAEMETDEVAGQATEAPAAVQEVSDRPQATGPQETLRQGTGETRS